MRKPRWQPGYMLLPKQRDAIILPVHIALNAIETGTGTLTLRHTLAAFLNLIGMCAKHMRTATETIEAIEAAKEALVNSDKRYVKSQRIGFSGPEMLAIRHAITLGDALLKRVNTAVLSAAVERVSVLNSRSPEVLGYVHEPIAA